MKTFYRLFGNEHSMSSKVARGGVWMFLLRMSKRTLDFLRIVILARFLAPNDFGLMGIAMISLQTLDAFSQTGFQTALVQRKAFGREYLDVAWSYLVVRGVILFSTLVLFAPFIAAFFNIKNSSMIIQAIAVSFLLQGFVNIGVIMFQKELEFRKQYIFEAPALLVEFLVSIGLVFVLKNVWSLIIGKLAGDVARIALSYILLPYRPCLSFHKMIGNELRKFGKWISGTSILNFLVVQGDSVLVGKIFGPVSLGIYKLAGTISNLPTTEFTHVISQVAFPAYAKAQNDLARLRRGAIKTVYLVAVPSILLSVTVFIFIGYFTKVFLGEKWLGIIEITKVLVVAGLVRSFAAIPGPILTAMGKPYFDTFAQLIRLGVFLAFFYPLSVTYGMIGVACDVLLSMVVAGGFLYYSLIKFFKKAPQGL